MRQISILLFALLLGCGEKDKECVCECPSAATAAPKKTTSTKAAATAKPKPTVAPRATPLDRTMSLADKRKAIAEQENPVRVKAVVKKKRGRSGVELTLENTTDKTVIAFSGFIYGFDKMDEPEEIAFSDGFTNFTSLEGTKIAPSQKTVQWYKSYYGLDAGMTVLIEIVKIKFADGGSWERGQ